VRKIPDVHLKSLASLYNDNDTVSFLASAVFWVGLVLICLYTGRLTPLSFNRKIMCRRWCRPSTSWERSRAFAHRSACRSAEEQEHVADEKVEKQSTLPSR
jgi:hypothetical protein